MDTNNFSEQFFHGTAHPFKEGDVIKPYHRTLHGPSTGQHVYVTTEDLAREYADMAIEQLDDFGEYDPDVHSARVFEVQPLGPVETDPAGIKLLDDNDNAYILDRRTSAARVIREVPNTGPRGLQDD